MSVINFGQANNQNVGTPSNSTVSASATTASVLSANSSRKRAIIYSPLSNTISIFIVFGATATVGTGYPLAPGQAWIEGDAGIYTGAFSCITASGSGSLLVTEFA